MTVPQTATVTTPTIGEVETVAPAIADAVLLAPHAATKTVAASGTAVKLTASAQRCHSVLIVPLSTNTGNVYVGDSTVNKTTSPQIVIPKGAPPVTIEVPVGYCIDLTQWYLDADVNGEGVAFLYMV